MPDHHGALYKQYSTLIRTTVGKLGKRYLAKAVVNNEYVSVLLNEYIDSISSIQRKGKDTPLCLFYQELEGSDVST